MQKQRKETLSMPQPSNNWTDEDRTTIAAKEYVDKQIETMTRHGSISEPVSEEEYDGLVREVVQAIRLWRPRAHSLTRSTV
jgi:hypothetical protein